MRHLVYAISITAVFIVPVAATNYYVTHPGAGNRKGTSLSNAWSVTDLNDSANWSSTENASKIDPGDVVYFSGTISDSKLTPPISGAPGKLITLDGWQGGSCDPTASACPNSAYFDNTRVQIGKDYICVRDIRFSSQRRAVIIGEGGPYVTGAEVRGCSFGETTWASLLAYRGNDCIVDHNSFANHKGRFPDGTKPGQNIVFLGGKRNRITNNKTYGGITAIIFLYSRTANGGGAASLIEDNLVEGNTCEGFLEEGISFDVTGSGRDAVATLEYDRVASASGSRITLAHANWSAGSPSYVGYDFMFMSGALAGRTRSITGQAGATFTLEGPVSGVRAGDEVSIGATFKRNLIKGNRVLSGGNGSILLYGTAFQNCIENNVLTGPKCHIEIRSLDNLERPKNSVTGAYGRAPCGYNTIRNNTVAKNICLFRWAVPVIHGHTNTYSPYISFGNNVIDNQCRQVVARHQNCYVAGNSGPNDLKKTTLASSPFKESGCRDRLTRDRFSGERGGIGREEPEGASSRPKE